MVTSLQMAYSLFFWNKNYCILIQLSLKFVSNGPVNNDNDTPAFVQVVAVHRTGDKPLFEPMIDRWLSARLQ